MSINLKIKIKTFLQEEVHNIPNGSLFGLAIKGTKFHHKCFSLNPIPFFVCFLPLLEYFIGTNVIEKDHLFQSR